LSDFVDLIQKILVLVLNAIQLVSGHNRWGVASHVDEEACGKGGRLCLPGADLA